MVKPCGEVEASAIVAADVAVWSARAMHSRRAATSSRKLGSVLRVEAVEETSGGASPRRVHWPFGRKEGASQSGEAAGWFCGSIGRGVAANDSDRLSGCLPLDVSNSLS